VVSSVIILISTLLMVISRYRMVLDAYSILTFTGIVLFNQHMIRQFVSNFLLFALSSGILSSSIVDHDVVE
jgi:hypothetical protein